MPDDLFSRVLLPTSSPPSVSRDVPAPSTLAPTLRGAHRAWGAHRAAAGTWGPRAAHRAPAEPTPAPAEAEAAAPRAAAARAEAAAARPHAALTRISTAERTTKRGTS